MNKNKIILFVLLAILLLGAISALVYTKIKSDEKSQISVTFKTVGNSFAEREWFPIELSNNGEEPIYYHNTACGGSIKILQNGVFQRTRLFECLYNGEGKLLRPGEKVILYDNIDEVGTYKRIISYSLEKGRGTPRIILETNEFQIINNDCDDEGNSNICPDRRYIYRIPPSCEYQPCFTE